jgi:uncharacterized protein
MAEFFKEILTVGEMASGAKLTVPVYHLKSAPTAELNAPKVYIQANMHGAEVQGNAVIFQLLELLKKSSFNGEITLVPYANPVACNHKNGEYTLGRFDPITGVNWNRMYHFNASMIKPFAQQQLHRDAEQIESAFKQLLQAEMTNKLDHNQYGLTTGQRIAYQLQKMAHQADIVLDLHTGPISSKHLYCPEYAKASASYFNIPHTILIPNEFDGAMDEATFCPWWSLQAEFKQLGREINFNKESFTVELGSQEQINLDLAREDALGILSYLAYKGFVDINDYPAESLTRYACYLKDYQTFYAPMGGMVDYLAEFGKPLAAGEPLARILRMDNYGDADDKQQPIHYLSVDQPVLPILHFASASVNQGTELYKVFQKYFIL